MIDSMCFKRFRTLGIGVLIVFSFAFSGCSFFKKGPVVPEMVFDEGSKYTVVEETAFFLEDPEKSEPERMLPPGADLRYVGPGPDPTIITVSEGGQEGYIYASNLEELEDPVAVHRRPRTTSNNPGPTVDVNPIDDTPGVPKIRIDGPGDIQPRGLGIGPR